MEARHLPSYLSNWTASFTAKRIMAFCFGNNIEAPQPYGPGHPQGSPGSPVLFLIYAQALLETPQALPEAAGVQAHAQALPEAARAQAQAQALPEAARAQAQAQALPEATRAQAQAQAPNPHL